MGIIESLADKKHCEMCGALKTSEGIDPVTERTQAEFMRRLAFVADKAPSLAVLLIHHIVGRTEREIAAKLRKPQSTIHCQIMKAQKIIRSAGSLN